MMVDLKVDEEERDDIKISMQEDELHGSYTL